MKKKLLAIVLAAIAPVAWAQVTTSESTTITTTSTDAGGTITEFSPGSSIVPKESSGPRTYRVGKKVTYVTKSGKTISDDEVRTRIKTGAAVHVHYTKDGDDMLVDRVILDED